MKVDTQYVPEFTVTLTRDELVDLARHPVEGVKEIIKRADKALGKQSPFLSQTKAVGRFSHKVECNKCHLMFEARGLGVHLFHKHGIKTLQLTDGNK